MGELRFFISVCVVVFHTSGYLGNIGYSSVFCFIIISGYCNIFSLEKGYNFKNYWWGKIKKIYVPYCVAVVFMGILWHIFYSDIPEAFPAIQNSFKAVDVLKNLYYSYQIPKDNEWWIFNAFPQLLPQNWTDPILWLMYILAPIIVYIKRQSVVYYVMFGLMSLGAPILSIVRHLDFPNYRYRSFFCLIIYFYLGTLLFYLKPYIKKIKHEKRLLLVLELLYVLYFASTKHVQLEKNVMLSLPIVILMVTSAMNIERNYLDKLLSKMSYYIYLTHFVALAIWKILVHKMQILGIKDYINMLAIVVITILISIGCIGIEKMIGKRVNIACKE